MEESQPVLSKVAMPKPQQQTVEEGIKRHREIDLLKWSLNTSRIWEDVIRNVLVGVPGSLRNLIATLLHRSY